MNNQRRKVLDKLSRMIEEIKIDLENVADEEQESLDCIPENLQGSERYEQMEEAVDNLCSAAQCLEEAMDYILEAV